MSATSVPLHIFLCAKLTGVAACLHRSSNECKHHQNSRSISDHSCKNLPKQVLAKTQLSISQPELLHLCQTSDAQSDKVKTLWH